MKKNFFGIVLYCLAVCLCLSCFSAFAEGGDGAEIPAFSWKGYEVHFPCMTADMEGYGLPSFHGSVVLVRLAAVEGTIKYDDFRQELFTLVDPDGNSWPCKFFVVPNETTMTFPNKVSFPDKEQDYIDLLFAVENPSEEMLTGSGIAVCEEKDGEPVLIPLAASSHTVEKKEK